MLLKAFRLANGSCQFRTFDFHKICFFIIQVYFITIKLGNTSYQQSKLHFMSYLKSINKLFTVDRTACMLFVVIDTTSQSRLQIFKKNRMLDCVNELILPTWKKKISDQDFKKKCF